MNNETLLNLIEYACIKCSNKLLDVNHINIFELMGGEDEEFENLFGKLKF